VNIINRSGPVFLRHTVAWFDYPTVKIILKIYLFVLTEYTNVTDRRTDTQTPHDGIGRTCIASRGKNDIVITFTRWRLQTGLATQQHFLLSLRCRNSEAYTINIASFFCKRVPT